MSYQDLELFRLSYHLPTLVVKLAIKLLSATILFNPYFQGNANI